ncbi:PTS IIA-like nitrogen regulatory protein PtsN [Sphingomonas nostoxanthinifaciens]|uniref:PTS IIA-like nitrogen regulatory protein PtsN n=1 Tax=Sphingomonas nostoxanthinifaciens TaxID=2872652 RepID=UPI001CC1D10D|nr:PTS IIA-like nitrogen regulatory protein PtsN [Sphingomonas nostoxanthinifaciens]UAK24644.1 PTS IIA-like nitrogen regulatory protein PtsN [Sphingomonas nostoxanthinifaciens]
MDDLMDILTPEAVLAGVTVPNKKTLFQQLGAAAQRITGIEARLIVDRLVERERLGSTGFGEGVAIPHGKIEGLTQVVGVFAKLATPVDFQSIDDMPVDLVFLLLSPPDSGVEHLKALARVSRRLRDRPFVAKLRGAGSNDALYALLTHADARDAA